MVFSVNFYCRVYLLHEVACSYISNSSWRETRIPCS